MEDLLDSLLQVVDEEKDKKSQQDTMQLFYSIAYDYKSKLSDSFVLVDGDKIKESVSGSDICVTKKIDGELRTVVFDGSECIMCTSGGTEEKGFRCLSAMAELLKSKNIKNAAFAAELNIKFENNKRCRVQDVIHAVHTPELQESLILTPFDILFIDDTKWNAAHYKETHSKLKSIFGDTECEPVEMITADSTEKVCEIYNKWVVQEKAEGLVVHTELPIIWKIKPQHTIDAVALGYTINEENKVRDIVFATMDEDGSYRIFAHGGNGLTENDRVILFEKFSKIKTTADFVYTDSRGVAFQMIEPEFVFETSAIDFSSENSRQEPNKNKLAKFSKETGWTFVRNANGVSTYSLKIIRERTDKTPVRQQIRTQQISDICTFSSKETVSLKVEDLPQSSIIKRVVYKKNTKNCSYVKKLVLLKTNKHQTGMFPSYILHFCDFSSSRANKMEKKLWVSEDVGQLERIMDEQIDKIGGSWKKC